jgi:hypothetical protein
MIQEEGMLMALEFQEFSRIKEICAVIDAALQALVDMHRHLFASGCPSPGTGCTVP